MLSVRVHDQDVASGRLANAGLDRRAVALVVGMANHAARLPPTPDPPVPSSEPSSMTRISCQVAAPRRVRDQRTDGGRFVVRRDDDGG